MLVSRISINTMDTQIMVESLPMLGVCTLCLNEGVVKSMMNPFDHDDRKETYLQILIKCYSIDLNSMELGDTKRLVCDTCILSLRQAHQFREQVETSLQTLVATVKFQAIKHESGAGEAGGGDDFTQEDDYFLSEILVKKEEETERRERETARQKRRKFKSRSLVARQKTACDKDSGEIETMLQNGLFPFKIHHNDTYSCAVCGEKDSNLATLRTHTEFHNRTILHKAFARMLHSSQRFYRHTDKLRCKICTQDIGNFDELSAHVSHCKQLRKRTSDPSKLPFKLEKDQLDCPVCQKVFISFTNLNIHMNVHYPNYICENCGKAFASKGRLRGHIRTHEIGDYPCKYCPKTFDRPSRRENHVSKVHKAGLKYGCRHCQLVFSSFYSRQKHLAESHGEELKKYKCKSCPQSYITPGHLSSHVRRDHLNERNHKCPKCDQEFFTRNALNMHMVRHDGARIHSCPVCQKSYQRVKTLREHMRIHNNDKRFVCPVCTRAFTQKCTLKGHMRVHERRADDDGAV